MQAKSIKKGSAIAIGKVFPSLANPNTNPWTFSPRIGDLAQVTFGVSVKMRYPVPFSRVAKV